MSTINVKVIDQLLEINNEPELFSGSVNVNKVAFNFDTNWTGFTKTAVFYNDIEKPYMAVLSGNNDCYIPHEVVENAGKIYFGVFGTKDDKVITSEILFYEIGQGALRVGQPSEPSQDLWQQVLSIVQGLRDDVKKYYEELKAISANFMSVEDVDKICGGEYDPTYDDYNVFPLSTAEILEVLK